MVQNAKRSRRGRPSSKEQEVTTVSGQLISWMLPGIKGQNHQFELMTADDLLTRKGWPVYREMMADDQVKACIWYKKVLLCARPFDLKPASEDEVDKEAAQFIQDNLMDINFKRILWETLSAFEFGFSVGEILWEIKDAPKGDKPGPKLYLKDVKHRQPDWLTIFIDKHGNIQDFVQRTPIPIGDASEIHLEPEKAFHYAYQRQFSNHYGISDLRAAYRAWWSKKYITQFWNVFLERFGSPLMMMKYPQGASDTLKTSLKSIMTNLSSKTDILVPEGVAIELIEATRAGTAQYGEALTHYDVRIATSILIPALLGMGVDTKRGSDSQSRLHLRTLMKVIQYLGDEIACEIQEKLIKPIVDANFNTDKYPRFMFQDYGEFEAFEITDAIKELWNAGLLDADQEDINFARSILGLPLRGEDNEDQARRPDPSLPPGTGGLNGVGGAGAQQSNDRAKKATSARKTDPATGRARPSRRKDNDAPPINLTVPVSITLPKSGKQVTKVTQYDDKGRIKEFEREETE